MATSYLAQRAKLVPQIVLGFLVACRFVVSSRNISPRVIVVNSVLLLTIVFNVAMGKTANQSSTAVHGDAKKAVDGNTNTCSATKREKNPWWQVNLQGKFAVTLVRIDLGISKKASVTVRVGKHRQPTFNPICNIFKGSTIARKPLYLPCERAIFGEFVSVHLKASGERLAICETFVYTEYCK